MLIKLFVLFLFVFVAANPSRAEITTNNPAPLNGKIIELVKSYPPQGDGGYAWPAQRGTHGTTQDLYLKNKRFARKGVGTHCVGITLEVMWLALTATSNEFELLTPPQVRKFRRIWFVPVDGGMGAAEALPMFNLGRRILNWNKAIPGDFIQLWNKERTSGHSAIFLSWLRNRDRKIVGVRYWSSQPWTHGLGVSEFSIGSNRGDMDPEAVFIGRLIP